MDRIQAFRETVAKLELLYAPYIQEIDMSISQAISIGDRHIAFTLPPEIHSKIRMVYKDMRLFIWEENDKYEIITLRW